MKFTYASGQKPLDGYTLKCGVGRGAFGEVYYALSDGGKEVALKFVCHNADIELRGIAQCLNLKHPNLVHLFDLRTDPRGDSWVVMEYVAGESLRSFLARHPQGIGADLARQWFAGLAAGVGYLHDQGIVHRDLKPGNIFLEKSVIKVGDYGLSKFISGSQAEPQTQSVGTVHYMAPEISSGNYNRQVDIYAAGIILYELLTGRVPFEGESVNEILMKHLTALPDLSAVPTAFVPILDRALAKNPAHRYRTMAEMGRDVEATAASPLSAPGGEKGVPPSSGPRLLAESTLVHSQPAGIRQPLAELCESLLWAAALAGFLTLVWAGIYRHRSWTLCAQVFFLTSACSWVVLIPSKMWKAGVEESWHRRLALAGLGILLGLGVWWLDGHSFSFLLDFGARPGGAPDGEGRKGSLLDDLLGDNPEAILWTGYLSFFGLVFGAMRWWKLAERRRPGRFDLWPLLVAAFWALALSFLLPAGALRWTFAGALVAAAGIIQIVAPWEPPTPDRPRRYRLRWA